MIMDWKLMFCAVNEYRYGHLTSLLIQA